MPWGRIAVGGLVGTLVGLGLGLLMEQPGQGMITGLALGAGIAWGLSGKPRKTPD